ncbi:alpha-glucuronidase [Xylanibacillus composti]|uniref:Xylan alpha-1,2-glucuronidase n=1 Tax=Xylanibacillus composti TaxID=1572762 RepID=A0A8J4H3N5_9BACL|nr:alpha-glucuronidase family glycosyl hydrolase [Xylanibacillus composti]MDT9727097.1 alpha-glucuronidase [Xylanibacillus composti]GIQ68892.1 xylan alpha-(1->2)-glucuronosidase [Xylanibacillus composti]
MASTMYKAWLQNHHVEQPELREALARWSGSIVASVHTEVLDTAVKELALGIKQLYGEKPTVSKVPQSETFIYVGVADQLDKSFGYLDKSEIPRVGQEGYILKHVVREQHSILAVLGETDRGALYGVFHLLRLMNMGVQLEHLHIVERPRNQLRMINQWDNADGTIERGYAGHSIFFNENQIVEDMTRIKDYARLLASVGINAIAINNVNVNEVETAFISEEQLPAVAKLADVFRSYGIRLYISIHFASPMELGGLSSADPLLPEVREWWKMTAACIYDHIPDFGGFLVKADSEHRPGPFAYGRDHAEGANMLAEALEPFGGIVIWRCFVYNCMQDWRDRSTDRARAAYDHFKPLDGSFHDNVVLQVKNGPMDFQVREPVSPLLGAMNQTNQMIEFQITQEYTGQQRHLCYLIPQWKEVLEFDTHAKGKGSYVKHIGDGTLFGMKISGYAAVSNIGDDENWTGHTLAQANLHGYGRLVWNPDLTAEEIAEEWIRLTFGNEEQVVRTVADMLLASWHIYEQYTAPLGVGWMVAPNHHYGPDVDGYEYSRWGTYHFADREGIGVDRTDKSGTGYAGQYFSPNREMYNQLSSCPDELLLFFHHVPYTHKLQSGQTVIQHIYETRFTGAERAEWLIQQWTSLEGKIDPERYEQVLERLQEQAEHAKEWRDVINTYFYRKSGIADEKGRTIYR